MIILLTGLPGSGKTEVTKFLHKKIPESIILRNDEIRRELFPGKPYNEDQKRLLDEAVLERTRIGISKNQTVILDRISPALEDRKMVKDLSHDLETGFVMIFVSSPESLIKERIEERLIKDPLSVPFSVYLLWVNKYEPANTADYNIVNDGDLIALEKSVDEIIQKL